MGALAETLIKFCTFVTQASWDYQKLYSDVRRKSGFTIWRWHQISRKWMNTYRFRNKSNRSGPVELALNYIVNCSSCVTNFKSSCLNASNSSWTNNNLANQEQLISLSMLFYSYWFDQYIFQLPPYCLHGRMQSIA